MSVLDRQSKLNPTEAFYAPASGGGGGGGGPNLSVSTITFPPAGGGNPPGAGAILMSGQLLIDDPATGIAGDFSFTTNAGLVGAGGATSTTALSIYAPNNASVFNMYAGADQALYIAGSAAGGDPVLYFKGIGNINISTLTCSTINGAVPGGGGGAVSIPANLAVSTLSINDSVPTNSARLLLNGSDPNLYSCGVVDSNAAPIASFTLGTAGGRNQFATEVATIPLFFTSSILGATGQISMNPAGADSIRLGGLGAPGDITLAPTGGGQINLNGVANMPIVANISSLIVSSINGAAPGGGSGVLSVQTIPSLGDTVCVCDSPGGAGNPTNLVPLASISTTLFHTYTVSGTAYWQGGGNQSATSFLQLQLGNISRFYDQCQPVSTIIGPNNYYSINWRFIAQGTGQNSIYAYTWDNNGSNASTIVNLQDVSITDYGILV